MRGQTEEGDVSVEQSKIGAPRVNRYAMKFSAAGVPCSVYAAERLAKESRRVPAQPFRQKHWFVRKPVDFFKRDSLAVEATEHRPTALGAKVDREIVACRHTAMLARPVLRSRRDEE